MNDPIEIAATRWRLSIVLVGPVMAALALFLLKP